MRALGVLVVILAAGCAGGDDTPLHGAGGGHGGTNDAPDAGPDTIDGGTGGPLTGEVCVIEDWRDPFACPAIALARGVQVTDLASGGATAVSDNTGAFSLALVDSGDAVIRVGGEAGDLLTSTQAIFSAADSPVQAPAVDEALWAATLANLAETQTEGAGVVYVVDPDGPVEGATITFTTSVPVDARRYYDDGAGGFDLNATATDAGGAAILLDIQNVGVRATALDGRTGTAVLDTANLEVGIAVITLPAAP